MKKIVSNFIKQVSPRTVWDLGGNDGTFSRLAIKEGASAITFDIDPASVEKNYLQVKQENETHMLPLLLDLTNPSPSIGWDNNERNKVEDRGPADLVMALALVHHLSISNNVPLEKVAKMLSKLGKNLIIEFVPKEDAKVKKLLATRKDIFTEYYEEQFEAAFSKFFKLKDRIKSDCGKKKIDDSKRTLYLYETKKL